MADKRVYATELLMKAILENPGAMNNPIGYLIHSVRGVGNIIKEDAAKFAENYKDSPLNVEELTIAGDLHDIGRPSNIKVNRLGQLCHEIESARLIEANGLAWGIGTQEEVLRIAKAVRTHSSVAEQYIAAFELKDPRAQRITEIFGKINPESLIQRTWQEAFITYADLCDKDGGRVDPTWKIQEAIERYKKDPKIADPVVVVAHPKAMKRLSDLCQKVEDAVKGKLTSEQVREYFGFL